MKVLRKQEIETANIQVGDQVIIPLAEIGEFSATAHKVTQGNKQPINQHERETDNFSGQKITDKTNADQKKYLAAWVEERRAV